MKSIIGAVRVIRAAALRIVKPIAAAATVFVCLAPAAPACAVTEFVTVVEAIDECAGIIERGNGDRWHIEVGPEASYFWRYEGKQARIKSAATFCGPGATILLPDDWQQAPVWRAKLIGSATAKGAGVCANARGRGSESAGGDIPQINAAKDGWRFRLEYDGRTIESAVDGRFDGWRGGTAVRTKDGRIWRQKKFYYFHCRTFSPKVTIYDLGPGFKMQVEGVPRAVEVEELE